MKKGYTLVELLITIVIVAIMLSIFIPTIIIMYNKIMISSSNNLKQEIFSKTSDYLIDNEDSLIFQKTNTNEYACIKIENLEITKSLINPKDNLDYTNYYVKVTKNNNNILKKEIVETEMSCYDPSVVALIPNIKTTLEVNRDTLSSNNIKAFYQNKDLSENIEIIDNTNNTPLEINQPLTEIGEYEIAFKLKVTDETTEVITKKIQVVDTTPPKINIIGDQKLILNINDSYQEQGIEITDNYYPDTITTENLSTENYQVNITSNLDTNQEGEYQIKYQVIDKSSNQTEVIKKVVISNQNIIEYSYSKKICEDEHETVTYDNWVDCTLEDGTHSKCNQQYSEVETKNVCKYNEYSPWSSVSVTKDENTKVRKKTCLLDKEKQVISSSCVITEE